MDVDKTLVHTVVFKEWVSTCRTPRLAIFDGTKCWTIDGKGLVRLLLSAGAARVALGTEVPVVFCNDDEVAAKLHTLSGGVFDQVNPGWRFLRCAPRLSCAARARVP